MSRPRLRLGNFTPPDHLPDMRVHTYWLDQRDPEPEYWTEPIPGPRLPQAWETFLRAEGLQHDQPLRRVVSLALLEAETKAPVSTGADRGTGRVVRKEPRR